MAIPDPKSPSEEQASGRTPGDARAYPDQDPGAEPVAAADERPAGTLARLLLVATPFALLGLLFLFDRLVRG